MTVTTILKNKVQNKKNVAEQQNPAGPRTKDWATLLNQT